MLHGFKGASVRASRSSCRIVLVLMSVTAGLLTFFTPTNAEAPSTSPWGADYFTNLPVMTHDGRTLRFYDDLIKDKIVVVNFIYTSCANICPLTTARLAEVKERLGDVVGRDIFFYSITIDPVMDGPEMLAKYAETFKAGPGWLFLTGKPDDIDIIRHKLGERSRSLSEHRNDVMLGNGSTGEWGRDSAFSDIDQLVATIRNMDPKWRQQVHTVIAESAVAPAAAMHLTPGQGLFIKACAACHTIGQGVLVGPDLAGTLERRNRDWLKRFLLAPDEMRAAKDPVAVALDEKYPGVSMPNLGLSPGDVDDLLLYLAAKSANAEPQISTQEHASSRKPAP